MGSCVSSLHKSSDSAMKLRVSFGSKNDKLEIPPSPVKEKPPAGRIKDVALTSWSPSPSSKTFADYGSKEEAFFDSQPWLESDCEDDFYSVNGDFTPSRGNTPVHQGFSMGSSKVSNAPSEVRTPGSTPAPFPTEKKKRLLELFKESIRDEEEESEANNQASGGKATAYGRPPEVKQAALNLPPKSTRSTPFISGANSTCSSERTPNNGHVVNHHDYHKQMRSAQCCLPSLVSCRSFSDRKKKMSPAIAANDRP